MDNSERQCRVLELLATPEGNIIVTRTLSTGFVLFPFFYVVIYPQPHTQPYTCSSQSFFARNGLSCAALLPHIVAIPSVFYSAQL